MIQEANLHWRYLDTESNLVMPWYTLPALEWLKKQDTKKWDVLEYGSGYSTIWWRLNCRYILSIESDPEWALAIGAIQKEAENFAGPHGSGGYDCIIIDGILREECIEPAMRQLIAGGFLIYDNYGQEGFGSTEKINALLYGWGITIFRQHNHTDWSTAVFQKP